MIMIENSLWNTVNMMLTTKHLGHGFQQQQAAVETASMQLPQMAEDPGFGDKPTPDWYTLVIQYRCCSHKSNVNYHENATPFVNWWFINPKDAPKGSPNNFQALLKGYITTAKPTTGLLSHSRLWS